MPGIMLEKTSRTPMVVIDPAEGLFKLEGESYPEDIAGFFTPVRNALEDSFGEMKNGLKVVIEILDQLDEQASAAFPVNVDWYCDPDDDITREFAEDISEDLNAVSFTIIDSSSD